MTARHRTRTPRPVPVERQQTRTKPAGCMIQVPLNGGWMLCCEVPFPGWTCPHPLGDAA